ncbi:hypothetical protein POM88_005835 [Heracleum sosnowskyi]|uniref:Uncharacterized protein n=1 Tax=Heracleum sosnowskyi TaxID=360622 RepID=A0AAD8N4Q7_9APIA|nr:hypothetical protein POM88_005835 [Heracleum sosnowskyi]
MTTPTLFSIYHRTACMFNTLPPFPPLLFPFLTHCWFCLHLLILDISSFLYLTNTHSASSSSFFIHAYNFFTASLHESKMLKQLPSRNQRSKEFKVKHALQICLLLAIGIWLLYQAKQTCHKKLALEESSRTAKLSHDYGTLQLGRKGLDPRLKEIVTDVKRSVHEDDDIGQEDKLGKSEGKIRGVRNDEIEIDVQDEEKDEEEEAEQLEDLIDDDDDQGKGSVEMDSDSEDAD